jgi:hypothetical protein
MGRKEQERRWKYQEVRWIEKKMKEIFNTGITKPRANNPNR